MAVAKLCTWSLPADARGREFFTACVLEPFHEGGHVVGASSHRGATLHEVDEESRNMTKILHARTEGQLEREEMGALMAYTDLLNRRDDEAGQDG